MGYTHYWRINANVDKIRYHEALADMRLIIRVASPLLEIDVCDDISINGLGKDGYETFFMSNSINPDLGLDDDGYIFNFCKTGRRPYDIIVVACLVVLATVLGEDARVTSDGSARDWVLGTLLADIILHRKHICPITYGRIS